MKNLGLLLIAIFSFNFYGMSSHISGGDITFTSLGNNVYVITLSLFRDCDGITMNTTSNITLESVSCGQNVNFTLPLIPNDLTGDDFTDISQLCEQEIPNSSCNGGTLPGMQLYVYQDTITLPDNCTDWVASWNTCCRNTTVNVPTSTSDDVFLMATFDNLNYPDNSSPQFTGQPIPYVCNGQSYAMDFFGVTEPDGDSVAYQFISAMEVGMTPLVYGGGYSGNAPMTGITIDPVSGIVDITPNMNGNFIVTVAVVEFDANGNVMSTVMRDIQLVVMTCNNEPPVNDDAGGGLANFQSATGTLVDSTTIEICEGQDFCFDVTMSDPDASDTVILDTTGFSNIIPGYTYSYVGDNPRTFTVCWTPPAGSPDYVGLPLSFTDQQCPITSIPYNLVVDITIFDAVVADPDVIICNNQGAQLGANGGNSFTWSVLSGDPISVGNNFTCNPCQNPIATPSVTTTYVVTGNLPAGCTQTDTVTVTVVPDYTFSVAQSGGVTCLADTIDLTTTINPPANYTYNWTVSDGDFNDPSLQNPQYIPSSPGTYDMIVEITSPQGCVDYDTAQVTVNPGFTPDFDLTTLDDTIDCGEVTDIDVNINSSIPAFCQASPLSCGATISTEIGNNPSNISTLPSPFYGFYEDSRVQMLYRASELNAQGFLGGKISELGFMVTNKQMADPYNGYTIKIGCTNLTELSTATTGDEYVPGLTTVWGPYNYNSVNGLNLFTLDQAYDWDGVSNIIVEICFDNDNWDDDDLVAQTTTAYQSVMMGYCDGCGSGSGCANTFNDFWSNNYYVDRPNLTLGYCSGDPDPNNYTFNYNPNTTVNPIQPDSVEVDPCTTTTYVVTVVDNITGCVDSAEITIVVFNPVCSEPNLTMDSVICNGDATGTIYAEAVGQDGPWTFEWTDSTNTIVQTTVGADFDTLQNVSAGWYWCSTTDQNNCVKYDSIYVGEPTPVLLTVSPDSTICIGEDVIIEAYASGGNGPYTYNWNMGLTNTDSTHLVTPTADTAYVLTVTDFNGCTSASDSVVITLNPPLSAILSPNDSICPGASTTITATASGGSGTGYDYQWTASDGTTYTGDSFTVTPTDLQTFYYLSLTDDCTTPEYLDTVMVLLQPYVADLTASDALCGGASDGSASVTITGTTGPYTLNWVETPSGTIMETDLGVVTTADVTILPAGNYELQISDLGGCQVDTAFTIGEPTPVTITPGNGSTVCLTDFASIDATAGGGTAPYTLTWNNGLVGDGPHMVDPLTDTYYTVFATDSNGCDSPLDSVLVQTLSPLTTSQLVDGTICPGDSYSMSAIASGGSGNGYTYNWTGTDGTSFTGDSITVTPTSAPVTYMLIVSDDCGTPDDTSYFTVNWFALPTVNYTGQNLQGCFPITSQFTANVNNALNYNWIFGDGNTTGYGQNMTATNSYDSPGCFDVTLEVETNDGCFVDTTYTQFVCAWDFPVSSFLASPQVTTTEETFVSFTNISENNTTNLWDFAGLGVSSVENPVFTFPDDEEGRYPVVLTVTNDYGCVDSSTVIIVVEQEVQFWIPNSFTPDGDQYNETWIIHGSGFDPYDFNVKVYNRYGEIVWESNNVDVGWDGKFMGNLVPDGVYVYQIVTKRLRDDSKVERVGHVTIIR